MKLRLIDVIYLFYFVISISIGKIVFNNVSFYFLYEISLLISLLIVVLSINFIFYSNYNFFIFKLSNFIDKRLDKILFTFFVVNFFLVFYYLILSGIYLLFWIYNYNGISYFSSISNIILNLFYLIFYSISLFCIGRVLNYLEERKSLISNIKYHIAKYRGELFYSMDHEFNKVEDLIVYLNYHTKLNLGDIPKGNKAIIERLEFYLKELEEQKYFN